MTDIDLAVIDLLDDDTIAFARVLPLPTPTLTERIVDAIQGLYEASTEELISARSDDEMFMAVGATQALLSVLDVVRNEHDHGG